ncbi:EAL domain-containing protein [Pseudokineococcus basanitobsidens]|uniref:EAL domain-containing protein n=1 Tax=Pseudokineococcus basanitobsidens TaxID=1926649 RepID=A0ABU8RNQ6_9ACTN
MRDVSGTGDAAGGGASPSVDETPPEGLPGLDRPAVDGTISDFTSAARAALQDLRERVGMDSWLVARRRGDDYVVLATAEDDAFGNRTGLVRPWEETFCARMVDGSAPQVAPVVDDAPGYARMRDATGIEARSYLSVPLHAPDGRLLGTLCAAGAQERGADLEAAMPSVRVQAGLLGTLLDHELQLAREVRRRERAESAAATDALTGVANRRAWDAALAAEEARAGRYASQACVVVLDLDALKHVNDADGHAAGDALLRRTADLLRERVRGSDLLARLGGDEFGLLLVEASPDEGREVARQVRDLLARSGIEASIGVGARNGDDDLHAAWRVADAAMYADKAARGTRPRARPGAAARAAASHPVVDGTRLSSVDALLELVREQLDMDATYVTRLEGDRRSFRNIAARAPMPARPGDHEPLSGTYCELLLDGRLENVVPDAAAHPVTSPLPVTRERHVGAYVGVPLHRADGRLYGTLCAHSLEADHRLRPRDAEVLRSIGGVVMDLVEEEDRREDGRRRLLTELDALEADGGPRTALQVVVDLRDGRPVGAEALSRFPAPHEAPSRWFARAAGGGAEGRLDLMCLQASLRHVGRRPGRLAVNASPGTVLTPAFTRLLGAGPLDHLVLELTEHAPVEDYTSLLAVLRPLRERGLLLAVDDAGAGYASMRHVVQLAPDVVKLDIGVVRGVERSRAGSAMAAALVGFARSTDALVLAEGVETVAERDHLVQLGVHLGQGHLFGRPELVDPPG